MIVPVVQGSPAWFEWRLGGLTASDAAAIWAAHRKERRAQTALQALLGRKLAPAEPNQLYPEHWRQRGPTDAVADLARRVGLGLEPACVQHDEADWLRATLQGLCWAGDALALVGSLRIAEHAQVLAGALPARLVPQAQHALLASGAGLCWYVSHSGAKHFAPAERWAVAEVLEDAELQAELLDAEREFWSRLCAARGKRESA